jgi:hypothetical protein
MVSAKRGICDRLRSPQVLIGCEGRRGCIPSVRERWKSSHDPSTPRLAFAARMKEQPAATLRMTTFGRGRWADRVGEQGD